MLIFGVSSKVQASKVWEQLSITFESDVQLEELVRAARGWKSLWQPFIISGKLGKNVAGMTGFEPAISALTGQRVRPLHHTPERRLVYHNIDL